jgi:hypothetical protein
MGPMTERGEGYCALVIPKPGQAPYGYAGCPDAFWCPGHSPCARSLLCPLAVAGGAAWLRARSAVHLLVSTVYVDGRRHNDTRR